MGYDTKGMLVSKTVWGVVISFAAMFLSSKGYVIDEAGYVNDVTGLIGAVVALYGRITATKRIEGIVK